MLKVEKDWDLLGISDLYGKQSVLDEHRVDLVCRLEKWQQGAEYERIGLERPEEELAGVAVVTLTNPMPPANSGTKYAKVKSKSKVSKARLGPAP